MLKVIDQTRSGVFEIVAYYIEINFEVLHLDEKIIYGNLPNGKKILLGSYPEKKAKEVLQEMVEAEEEQNSFYEYEKIKSPIFYSIKGTQVLNTEYAYIEIPMLKKQFKIYKMPQTKIRR